MSWGVNGLGASCCRGVWGWIVCLLCRLGLGEKRSGSKGAKGVWWEFEGGMNEERGVELSLPL